MKRSYKHVNITDPETIRPWVVECIKQTFAIYSVDRVSIDMMGFVVHANGKVTMRGRNYIKSRRLILRLQRRGMLTFEQSRRLVSFKGFYKFSDYAGDFKAFKKAQNIIRKGATA